MKKIIIAISVLIVSIYSYAQNPYSTSVQGPITPSVAAMSFGKYADMPIDPRNGTMAFSIPLFTLSDGPLTHNLSLSYHTGGIRVSEMAGDVGLGWHLNAGGVISRTVRGLPDDDSNGYFYKAQELVDYRHAPQASKVANGELDAEPDLFFYNVNGISGKFVFDEIGEPHMIPKSNVKIEKIQDFNTQEIIGFTLISTDGTKYHFGYHNGTTDGQTTQVESKDKYYDTWHLYKISSFDERHEITFSYADNDYKYKVNADCHVTKHYDNGQKITRDDCDGTVQDVKIEGRILSSITTSTSTVSFTTDSRFDLLEHNGSNGNRITGITLNNGPKCISYDLKQNYFYDSQVYTNGADYRLRHRLRLDTLQKITCTVGSSDVEEPYVFTYLGGGFFPYLTSKAIDHWGYYNGADDNNDLDNIIPSSSINTITGNYFLSYGLAERDTDEAEMKKGMLKNIKYPTKGFTQFSYEAHQYEDIDANRQSLFDIETCTANPQSACCGIRKDSITQVLDEDMISSGILALTIDNEDEIEDNNNNVSYDFRCSGSNHDVEVIIKDANGDFVDGFSTNSSLIEIKTVYKNLSEINGLVAGNSYRFVLTSNQARGALEMDYAPSSITTVAGGLRIKDIYSDEKANVFGINSILRTFSYTKENSTESSGYLTNKPKYVFIADESDNGNSGRTALFASTGVLPLTNSEGSHIFYTEVTEHLNGNGYKKYLLEMENYTPDQKPDYPVKAAQFLVKNGVLKEEASYNQNGTKEKSSIVEGHNVNVFNYEHIPGIKYASVNVKLYNGSSTYDGRASSPYSLRTNVYRPKKVTTFLDGVTEEMTYDYHGDDKVTLSPIKVSTTNSDGLVSESVTKYSAEYEYDTAIKDYFTNNNIIGIPYQVENYVDGKLLDGTKTLYSYFNIWPRPSSKERYQRTWENGALQAGEWITQETFNAYNTDGLLTDYQKSGWLASTYSYNVNKLLETQKFNGHEVKYDYYPNSTLLQKKTNIDGTSMSYTYDGLMRLHTATDDNTGAKTTTTYDYATSTNEKSLVKTVATFLADQNGYSQLTQLESRQYLDGLGRPIQTVEVGQGPNGNDLLSSVAYDNRGRLKHNYETIESANNTGAYVAPASNAKKSTIGYHSSPLNRDSASTPTEWFAATMAYSANQSSDGVVNQVTGQPFPDNSLFKQTVTDPNGNPSITFTDLKGRLILSRRVDSNFDTYYIYDNKDRLIEVIPPGSSKGNANLNYFYEYDDEGKLNRKKIPSKDWITFRYNERDLLVGEQDGYLATNNKWYVYNYDDFGREIKSGLYDNSILANIITGNPTISELLIEDIYGTTTSNKDKVETSKAKILGTTNDWLSSTYTYDNAGRIETAISNNHLNLAQLDRVDYFYDGASNVVKSTAVITDGNNANNTIDNITYIATNGRTTSEWINANGQLQQLCEISYTAKDEIATKYIGGNSSSHLQKVDYNYLENGLLHKVNNGSASGGDLFGYQLNYFQNPTISGATTSPTPRFNGDISSIQWVEIGESAQLSLYKYDDLDRLTNSYTNNDKYNTSYTYDVRGNFTNIKRYADINGAPTLIDNLTQDYKANNANLLDKVLDATNNTQGYKSKDANLIYEYDANGNLEKDPQKGIDIIHNYLDLCEEVKWSENKKIKFTYAAGGTLLRREVINDGDNTVIDYVGPIEFKDNEAYVIHHAEGRIVKRPTVTSQLVLTQQETQNQQYTAQNITSTSTLNGGHITYEVSNKIILNPGFQTTGTATFESFRGTGPTQWVFEWDVRDHLGNLRLVYSDLDNNGSINTTTEILETADYYPYGLRKTAGSGSRYNNAYAYNGIEEINDFGLGVNMAGYRTLDPTLGLWWSVDPQAESLYGLSPYQSMGNNPIYYNDPNGDFIAQVVGGVVGAGLNVFNNWDKIVRNPWSAIGYATTGAGAGVAASFGQVGAARGILAAGNVATDIATGNIPNLSLDNFEEVASYAASTAIDAISTAGTSRAVAKLAETSLKAAAKKGGKELLEEGVGALAGGGASGDLGYEFADELIYGELWSTTEVPGIVVTAKRIDWAPIIGGNLGLGTANTSLGVHGNDATNKDPSMVYHHTFTNGKGEFKTYTGVDGVGGGRAIQSKTDKLKDLGEGWKIHSTKTTTLSTRKKALMVEQLMINKSRRVNGASTVINQRNPGRKFLTKLNKIF